MRIGRHELLLAAGLSAAAAVAFTGQVSIVLQAMRDFEMQRHVGLLPGLAIAALSLLGYFQVKRRRSRRRADAAEVAARTVMERAQRLERLVSFWQAVAEASDIAAVSDVIQRYLPEVTGSPDAWMVAGDAGGWRHVFGPTAVPTLKGETPVADLANAALSMPQTSARPEGVNLDGQICFPLFAADTVFGVVGVPASAPALVPERHLLIGATVTLVTVTLNSLHLLRQVRESSMRDALTGCANRAHAMERIEGEMARAARTRQPLSLIMLDLDRFKSINDRYGHLCGDTVLARIGAALRTTLRVSDLKCRYGGEEFLVLLPDTPLDGARHAAETLRLAVSRAEVSWNGEAVRLTASFGAASARPGERDAAALIARADLALYRAKREGRDRVALAVDEPDLVAPGMVGAARGADLHGVQ